MRISDWSSDGCSSDLHQLIDDKDKKALYIAARIRSSMDWADGMNWSRYYNIRSSNYGDRPLSLGRVQTATLALLVDRDEAIARFVPSAYFELKATMNLPERSEEHTSELQSLMRISYAVFCLKKKQHKQISKI